MNPPTPQQLWAEATSLHQAGRVADAEPLYRRLLQFDPKNFQVLNLLGMVTAQLGKHAESVELIRRGIAVNPNVAESHNNLGNALVNAGRAAEGMAAYRQAVRLKPDSPQLQANLGFALLHSGDWQSAIGPLQTAVQLQPGVPDYHAGLGDALKDGTRPADAVTAYRKAIALNPNFAEVHANLGVCLQALGQLEEAIRELQLAIQLKPDLAAAYNNLGNAFHFKGALDEAVAAFESAHRLAPNLLEPQINLGGIRSEQGYLEEAIAAYRRAIAIQPNLAGAWNNLLYSLHFHPDSTSESLAVEHRRFNEQVAKPLKSQIRTHANDRNPDRRLRIGYVSPYFRAHPVGRFLHPLLEHHDRNQVEIVCYSDVARPDATTEHQQELAQLWRRTQPMTDAQLADQIREDRIDILVDLTLHMLDNRLLMFARKPAPVQVTYLAYAGSSGLDTIDYRLSDPHLDPSDRPAEVYSEETIRLPRTYWCYQPVPDAPEPNELPAIAAGHVTFGCLNNFSKVSPPARAAWAKLLRAVPGSRLILHTHPGAHRAGISKFFADQQVDPSRIEFAGFAPTREYIGQYHRIDIALDPFPYTGGTTTCDALWMGVPVVSLAGETGVARSGLSLLSNIGLNELVARSVEEYVQIAQSLAADPSRLISLRAGLRDRMRNSPLTDGLQFARDVESAFRGMWRRWCDGDQV